MSVPEEFVCKITGVIMADPVVASDGFSYERTALKAYFEAHNTQSKHNTAVELIPNVMFTNTALLGLITKFLRTN